MRYAAKCGICMSSIWDQRMVTRPELGQFGELHRRSTQSKGGGLRLLRTPLRYSAVAVQSMVLIAVARHLAADYYGSDNSHMHFNRIMLATAR